MKTAILICGYRRSGKDAFASDLIENSVHKRWYLYSRCEKFLPLESLCKYKKIAFANKLKVDVAEIIGIPISDIDECKDEIWKDNMTIRDLLIEHATNKRKDDPDYWCKRALENAPDNVIITDFRFPNELEYVKKLYNNVIIIRIISRDVPVPDPNVFSEHGLDGLTTDYFAIPCNKGLSVILEYCNALALFPQYKLD